MKRKILCVLLTVLLFALVGFATGAKAADADMTVSQQFLDVLKKWEGFSATPYKDNGQYTFGYGCKCPSDKVDYYTKNPLTTEQAEALLREQLAGYEKTVNEFADRYNLNLLQHQFDALVSFTYNCGGTWVNDKTGYLNTAVREMNTGAQFIYGLGLWGSSGGRYILVQRRMKEANMFINGVYDTVPSNYGWVYLNGNGGTLSYKIFCFDAELKTAPEVEFKAIPTGTGADGKPFVYTFAGWYTENGKKVEVLDNTLTRGQTLYARWKDPSGKVVTPPAQQPVSQDGFPKTATVVNATDKVNARSGPGSSYVQVGTVAAGSRVTVVEEVIGGNYTIGNASYNLWCKLSDNRYVAKYYLQYDNHKVTSIKVIKQPTVTSYRQPIANPRLEGSVLQVTYSSGHTEAMTIKKNMVSGFNGNKQGKQTITITYGGKTTTMTVNVLPPLLKITSQPADAYATAGNVATVSVRATGEGLTYTWYHKNAKAQSYVKASYTGATYKVTMSATTNGRTAYCVVRDKYGNTLVTNTATVHLVTPLAITAQPKGVTVDGGSKAAVSVKAQGDGLSYTWYEKNVNETAYRKFAGTATYSVTATAEVNGRYVFCVVKDKYGNSVKTDTVRIFVVNRAQITSNLSNGYAKSGKRVSVSIGATGDGLSYTWYHKNASASAFVKAATTGATYTTTMSSSTNGRYVYCVVRDQYGNSVTSNVARLWQGNPLVFTTRLVNGYGAKGQKAAVTVKATGDGLTYTWYHKNAGTTTFVKAATTGATYTTTMSSTTNGRYVYCVVRDQNGNSFKTNVARVFMGTPPKITAQPQNGYAANGSRVSVGIKAAGEGVTYTWYHKNASASAFVKAATTGATYTTTMSTSANGRYVYCVVTDKYGTSVQSNTVRLYMGAPLKITAQPKNTSAYSGKKASVTVEATGEGLTYTWYHKNATASKFVKAATEGATYTTTMSSTTNGRYVYCVVRDKYGASVQTNTVRLYMGAPLQITAQPKSASAASGRKISATVKATGDGLTYTWYHKNAAASTFVKAATEGATYTTTMSSATNGRMVYCVIKDKYGATVQTNMAVLSIK